MVTLKSCLMPVSWSPEKTLTFLSSLQLGQKEQPRALEPCESQRPVQGDRGPRLLPPPSWLETCTPHTASKGGRRPSFNLFSLPTVPRCFHRLQEAEEGSARLLRQGPRVPWKSHASSIRYPTLAMSSFCLYGLDSHEGGWLHPPFHPPPLLPVEEEPLTLSLSPTVGVGSQSCRKRLGLTQKAQASPSPLLPPRLTGRGKATC